MSDSVYETQDIINGYNKQQQAKQDSEGTTTYNIGEFSQGMSATATVVSSANPPSPLGNPASAPPITV